MTEAVTHCPACGKQAAYVTRYGCAGARSPCALAHLPAEWPRSAVDAEAATPAWDCDAYGPEGAEVGALCFFQGEAGVRKCADLGECRQLMAAERRRVFRRISELAAGGDDTAAFLEGEFSSPEQILGGGEESDEGPTPRPPRRTP